MAIYKYCSCGKRIEYALGKCLECKEKAEKQKKIRYKNYRNNKEKDKESEFYNTKSWKRLRDYILSTYFNMSIYSYYKTGKIVQADTVHHVIEVREDWDKRLDKFNLIPITLREHREIHRRIDLGQGEEVKRELDEMLEKFRDEFEIRLE